MSAKHIATYPIYGTHPLTLAVQTSNRVDTGYIHKPEQIEAERERLARYGHPLRLKWRNPECYADYLDWTATKETSNGR